MWTDRTADGRVMLTAFGAAGEAWLEGLSEAVARAVPGAVLGRVHVHDWMADPFARGVWVAPPAPVAEAYAPAPPQGMLHFAGSDIAGTGQGWFEGAVVSGQAAAEAVAHG
jgi:monoamine oxidase